MDKLTTQELATVYYSQEQKKEQAHKDFMYWSMMVNDTKNKMENSIKGEEKLKTIKGWCQEWAAGKDMKDRDLFFNKTVNLMNFMCELFEIKH